MNSPVSWYPLDVVLELARLDAPLAASADLDRLEVPPPDQGVCLGRGDVEHLGDIGKLQEPWCARTHGCEFAMS
jgi:hypothetical protein